MGIKDLFQNGFKGTVSGVLDGASNIISKLKADPTKVIEVERDLETLRVNTEVKMKELDVRIEEIDAKRQEVVNQTMQVEAKSEHFLVWSWRPLIGYMFILVGLNNFVVMPYLRKYGLQPIELPADFTMAILAILGIASYGRSQVKVNKSKR